MAGKMTQPVKALAAHEEDWSLIPSGFQQPVTTALENPRFLPDLCKDPHAHACTHT